MKAVPGTGLKNFDVDRVENYFLHFLKRKVPNQSDIASWIQLLLNTEMLVATENANYAPVTGILLFGNNPNYRLPQAGITVVAFPGVAKD